MRYERRAAGVMIRPQRPQPPIAGYDQLDVSASWFGYDP
jgi:hypothetical protein